MTLVEPKLISGVYHILNIENGKRYIGSSKNVRIRLTQHKSDLSNQRHDNLHLQNAWNKYSKDKFVFEILEYTKNYTERETQLIQELKVTDKTIGYNIQSQANNNKGIKRSPEFKEKIRKIRTGWKLSEETKNKIREKRLNNPSGFLKSGKSTPFQKGRAGLKGEKSPTAKLTWSDVRIIRELANEGASQKELGQMFNIDQSQVCHIVNHRAWKENTTDFNRT